MIFLRNLHSVISVLLLGPALRCAAEDQPKRPPLPPQAIAMDLATGNWKAQATRAFVTSGIAAAMEELCSDGNFVSATTIAEKSGLKTRPTYRLLRYLSTLDVAVEGDNGNFTLGPIGEVMTPNHPQSVARQILWESDLVNAKVWSKLPEFLETDKFVTPDALDSPSLWSYLENNPETLATFSRAMSGYSVESAIFLSSPELSPTFDLSQFSSICDLGAAEGQLSLLLNNRFPQAKYLLADLPNVMQRLDSTTMPPNFSLHGTDFLQEQPPQADAYLLKYIIHDWDDSSSGVILQNIRKANPTAPIFVIEFGPMPGPNVPHLSKAFDLHMAVHFGSAERTDSEYDALWAANGYKRLQTHYLAGGNYPVYVQELHAVNAQNTEL